MKFSPAEKRFFVSAAIFAAIAALGIYAVLPVFEPMPDDAPLLDGFPAAPEGAGTRRLRELAEKAAARHDAHESVKHTPEAKDFIDYFKKQRERGTYADCFRFPPPDMPLTDACAEDVISEFPDALLTRRIPWDETAAEKISALPENREALAVFEEESDFSEDPYPSLGTLSAAAVLIPVQTAPLIQLKIRTALERGDSTSALARFRRTLAHIRSREDASPTLISLLASIHIRRRLFSTTLQDFFITGTQISAETLAALRREVETERSREIDFVRVLQAEYAYARLVFKCMRAPDEAQSSSEKFTAQFFSELTLFSPRAAEKSWRKTLLRQLALLESGKTPFELEKEEKARPRLTFREIVSAEMPTHLQLASLGDALPTAMATAEREHLRTIATARITLAAHEYRLAHGAFPQTLDALVPEFIDAVPCDPRSGARYAIDPETNVVFPEDAENGGEIDEDNGLPLADNAFRLRGPDAARALDAP